MMPNNMDRSEKYDIITLNCGILWVLSEIPRLSLCGFLLSINQVYNMMANNRLDSYDMVIINAAE